MKESSQNRVRPCDHLRFAGRSTWGPGRVDKETMDEMMKEGLIRDVPCATRQFKQGRDSIMTFDVTTWKSLLYRAIHQFSDFVLLFVLEDPLFCLQVILIV